MNLDIDFLISFYKKYSGKNSKGEMDEQEAESSGQSTGAKSGKSVKKWETGLTRGPGNQVANTVWGNRRKFGKTYMNDPKYVWKSDRVMGKTGGSDFV